MCVWGIRVDLFSAVNTVLQEACVIRVIHLRPVDVIHDKKSCIFRDLRQQSNRGPALHLSEDQPADPYLSPPVLTIQAQVSTIVHTRLGRQG